MDKQKMLVGVVLALAVVLVVLAAIQSLVKKDSYYAVYLRTGDIYFGQMVRFPYFGLKNIYTIQVTQDPQTPLRIQKFTDIFWGPEDYMRLNRDEVVWYTRLKNEGQLYQLLRTNPNLLPQQQVQQPVTPATTTPATTTTEENQAEQ
jgi:hypothetical protein